MEENSVSGVSVRPGSLDEFIGQTDVRQNLKIYLQAAKERGQQLDHTLLYGNPGLGKTTLAQIMASELGVNLVSTSGPVLEKSGDLAAVLTSLNRHDILFIDEIHTIVGAGSAGNSSMDASNILKPLLANGKLRCIGATTLNEYKNNKIIGEIVLDATASKYDKLESTILIRYQQKFGFKLNNETMLNLKERLINKRGIFSQSYSMFDKNLKEIKNV